MVYSKRIAMFAVKKDKITRKPLWSQLRLNFLQVIHFSLSKSCLTNQTAQEKRKNIKSIFFNVSAYDWCK